MSILGLLIGVVIRVSTGLCGVEIEAELGVMREGYHALWNMVLLPGIRKPLPYWDETPEKPSEND